MGGRQFGEIVGQKAEKAVKAVVPVPPAPKIIGRVWTAPRCSPLVACSATASGAAGPTVPWWPSSCSTQAVPTSTSTIPASAGASGSPRRLEYGGPEVVNLYAFLATDPAELRRAGYPVGPDNDQQITEAVHESSRVVAAWGVHSARLGRPKEVLGLLSRLGATPYCLRVTSSGHPEHPLRLPSSCDLRPFQG